jgi:nicotinamidase-related amidase
MERIGVLVGHLAPGSSRTATISASPTSKLAEGAVQPYLRTILKNSTEAGEKSRAVAKAPNEGQAEIPCKGGRAFPVGASDTALVIIDMQTDFLSPEGRVGQHYKDAPIRNGLQGVERLLAAARKAGLTVAHSRSHRYGADVRDDLVGTEDEGYELYPSCRARPGEIVVDKWTFGAFASTDLEAELRSRGVKRILLCGVLTNVCVFATASQAVDRFFRVCVVEDACAAFDQDWHDMAIRLISEPQCKKGHQAQIGLYFGEVSNVSEVEKALAAVPSGK